LSPCATRKRLPHALPGAWTTATNSPPWARPPPPRHACSPGNDSGPACATLIRTGSPGRKEYAMFDHLSGIDLPVALLVDVVTVTLSVALLLRYGRLSHSHPGTIYLFFHFYTFTFRLLGLLFGAETLFSQFLGFFEPVTHGEIVRAALIG